MGYLPTKQGTSSHSCAIMYYLGIFPSTTLLHRPAQNGRSVSASQKIRFDQFPPHIFHTKNPSIPIIMSCRLIHDTIYHDNKHEHPSPSRLPLKSPSTSPAALQLDTCFFSQESDCTTQHVFFLPHPQPDLAGDKKIRTPTDKQKQSSKFSDCSLDYETIQTQGKNLKLGEKLLETLKNYS